MSASLRTLGPNRIAVWYAVPEAATDAATVQRYLACISPDERERYRRFRFDDDRHTYLVAHALVRTMLSEALGVAPLSLRFDLGPHGKPEVAADGAPPPLRFNMSHTRGLVACAITRSAELGVDVEHLDRNPDIDALARSVFSDDERAALDRLTGDARRERFFRYWTLKEAYIKAIGKGLSLPLRSVNIEVEAGPQPSLRLADPLRADGAEWWLHTVPLFGTHMLSLALRSTSAPDVVIESRLP